MIAILWVVVLGAGVPLAMFFVLREFPLGTTTVQICTLVWPAYENDYAALAFTIPSVLFMLVLPLTLILVNYIRIMGTMKASMKKFKSNIAKPDSLHKASTVAGRLFKAHKEMRVIYLLMLIVTIFCVLWIPLSVSFVLILYDGWTNALVMTSQLFVASVGLSMMNTCVNPVIYAFVNDRYRIGLVKLLQICRCRNRNSNAVHPISVFQIDTTVTPLSNDGYMNRPKRTDSMIAQVSFYKKADN